MRKAPKTASSAKRGFRCGATRRGRPSVPRMQIERVAAIGVDSPLCKGHSCTIRTCPTSRFARQYSMARRCMAFPSPPRIIKSATVCVVFGLRCRSRVITISPGRRPDEPPCEETLRDCEARRGEENKHERQPKHAVEIGALPRVDDDEAETGLRAPISSHSMRPRLQRDRETTSPKAKPTPPPSRASV